MSPTTIFLTGASGYIGGSVLHALLHAPNTPQYTISALVRGDAQIQSVQALGVRVVPGSLDDHDVLKKEASDADIVIHTASAQDLAAALSLAAGVAQRAAQQKPAYLIHTSGTSAVADFANGAFLAPDVYADTDDIYALEHADRTYPQRAVDVALTDAGERDAFPTAIVVPPTIYGAGTGPGRGNTHQVRMLVLAALRERQAHYVNAGLSAWAHVHIEDLAALYVALVDAVRAGTAPRGRDAYFFAETGEHTWKQLSEGIAATMHAKGLVDSPVATPFASDQAAADALTFGHTLYSNLAFGTNARVRGVRGRRLGWAPRYDDAHFLGSMPEQVDYTVAHAHEKKLGEP